MGAIKLIFSLVVCFFLISTLSYAQEICYYKGPDTSNNAVRLENFVVSAEKELYAGDFVTVEFDLTYTGTEDAYLGKYGVHGVSKDSSEFIERFGATSGGSLWKKGKTISFKNNYVFDKPGSWVIWPSYHFVFEKKDYFGPDGWHSCKINVNEKKESDSDNDGIVDSEDNCPDVSNQGQDNSDNDSYGDACDNCRLETNEEQLDSDTDGKGDACDECDDRDNDKDGIKNCEDKCVDEPETFNDYLDKDGCPDDSSEKEPLENEDNKKPEIVLFPYPLNITKGKTATFRAEAKDSDGIETIIIFVNGNKIKECKKSLSCSADLVFDKDLKDVFFGAVASDSKGLLASSGRGILEILGEGRSIGSCVDSDDGNNPFRMGFVQNESAWTDDEGVIHLPKMYFDECVDGGRIKEYYCNESRVVFMEHECNGICYDSGEMAIPGGSSFPVSGDACVCEETDYGLDKFNYGYSGASPRLEDYCINEEFVMEYYCEDNELFNQSMYCIDGCFEGKCRCEDSDGGKNYFEKGWFLGRGGLIKREIGDICDIHNEQILHEIYPKVTWFENKCEVKIEDYECPGLCSNGRCLEPSCEDGFLNQGEEDIDCGGPNCPVCETCYDNIWNQDEDGVDCGGSCIESCPACIPLVVNTNRHSDAIDVVFVMDEDYGGDERLFIYDVKNLINHGYFGNSILNNSKTAFNFYTVSGEGDYEGTCSKFDVPDSVSRHCSFRDSVAIVHRDIERDCASGSVFSTEWNANITVVHESGHAIFGLADEYCCDGGYWQAREMPNIFESERECEDYADSIGESRDKCFKFCPSEKYWPGTAGGIASCEAFFTRRGWDISGCNCTLWASSNGLDPGECEEALSWQVPDLWHGIWLNRGIARGELTVKSPMWCNYRGGGIRNCCEHEWWKLDSDPNSLFNTGNCIMRSGNQFDVSCEIRIQHKLDEILRRRGR